MPKDSDEQFDANEALTRPASASGQAYSKFLRRSNEIDTELNRIIESASEAQAPSTDNLERQRELGQRALDTLTAAHTDLKESAVMDEFRAYVQANSNNLLEVLYQSFRAGRSTRTAVRKLLVREMDTIAANRQGAATQPSVKSVSTGEDTPAYLRDVDPKVREAVAKDANYFGDYH